MQITFYTPANAITHQCSTQVIEDIIHIKCNQCAHYRCYNVKTGEFTQVEAGYINVIHIYPAVVAPGLDVDGGNQIN